MELRTAEADGGPDDRPDFLDGLGAGWAGLRELGGAVAAAVGFALPFLPVLAAIGIAGWATRRWARARRARGGRSGPRSDAGS